MKQLQVLVKNKNTLVLLEDGMKDDLINLAELSNVDLSAIEEVIESGKDQVYQKKLNELTQSLEKEKKSALELLKVRLDSEYNKKITELNEKISVYDSNRLLEIEKINSIHVLEVERLNSIIKGLEDNQKQVIDTIKLQLENKYKDQINELNKKIESISPQHKLEIEKIKNEYDSKINEIKLLHAQEINKKNEVITQKELQYQELQNRKASLNIKMIGEELETWCNNEMLSYMQNGFLNCKWIKDNNSVKNEGETSGTKADYIFNIYANESCNDDELLAGVCLDMKDENPNSTHKKKNSDHLSTLHKNRVKKGCKYAVLVSNLELDNPNDLPILKVRDYEDMYIVRPAYMLVLLNMIASLTTNFKDLLLQAKKEELEIKSKTDLLNQFETLKKSYLENGLLKLEKQVNDIKTKSSNIIKAADDIDNICNTIINGYLREIQNKLETFEVKIIREYKKYTRNCL